jgi:hypothetical protein
MAALFSLRSSIMTEEEILAAYSTAGLRRTELSHAIVDPLKKPKRPRCFFIATFVDDIEVHIPTRFNGGNPSVESAKFFAGLAYQRHHGKKAPAIAKAHFETGPKGQRKLFRTCSAEELIKDRDDPAPVTNPQFDEWALEHALGVVKDAGFKVSKPRAKSKPKSKSCIGPTCVCTFADGETVRMTTNCTPENLDWRRGECLARAAYATRWRAQRRPSYSRAAMQWWMGTDWKQKAAWTSAGSIYEIDLVEPVLPAIVSMHFERDGQVLGRRDNGGVS